MTPKPRFLCVGLLTLASWLSAGSQDLRAAPEPLLTCATVPDLARLCEAVGGEEVRVRTLVKGPQDPHFLEPRPSFIKALSRADLFIQTGLDLETAWAPLLWRNARNGEVLPGSAGFIDASAAVTALEVPAGILDRSLGDVHPRGNPHYLVDPLMGLKAAQLIRDRLSRNRPANTELFSSRFAAFQKRAHEAFVGKALAEKYDVEKLATLHEHGKLLDFLIAQGDREELGGWLGRMAPHYGTAVVADHNYWPYFARRFGLRVVGFFEPKPGVPPTTRHLKKVIETMRAREVRVILTVPYFAKRHAQFVASETGARIAALTHQCEGVPGTDDYLAMVEYNVTQLEAAIGESVD